MPEALAIALPIVIQALRALATPESQVTEEALTKLLGPQALAEVAQAQELLKTMEASREPS